MNTLLLESLPLEIQYLIISFTLPFDMGRLTCVSKRFMLLFESENIWKIMYDSYFGGPSLDHRGYRMSLIKNHIELEDMYWGEEKLMWIIAHGHYNALRFLLSNTSFININHDSNTKKRTPLHLACTSRDFRIPRVLLSFGADIEAVDGEGSTPLHLASEGGHTDVVYLLLSKSADVNCKDERGRTALHKSSYNGHSKVIPLLAIRADMEIRELSYEQTALHIACGRNHVEAVGLLILAGANVDAVDRDGWTPLHIAAYKGYEKVVEVLLNHGASTQFKVADRWTAMEFAVRRGYHPIVHMLSA